MACTKSIEIDVAVVSCRIDSQAAAPAGRR